MLDQFKIKLAFLSEKIQRLNSLINISYSQATEPQNESFGKSEVISLAEIRSLLDNLEFYVASNLEVERTEIMDFIDFSNHVYSELVDTIKDDDRNTSWLVSRYDQYNEKLSAVQELIKLDL